MYRGLKASLATCNLFSFIPILLHLLLPLIIGVLRELVHAVLEGFRSWLGIITYPSVILLYVTPCSLTCYCVVKCKVPVVLLYGCRVFKLLLGCKVVIGL